MRDYSGPGSGDGSVYVLEAWSKLKVQSVIKTRIRSQGGCQVPVDILLKVAVIWLGI